MFLQKNKLFAKPIFNQLLISNFAWLKHYKQNDE